MLHVKYETRADLHEVFENNYVRVFLLVTNDHEYPVFGTDIRSRSCRLQLVVTNIEHFHEYLVMNIRSRISDCVTNIRLSRKLKCHESLNVTNIRLLQIYGWYILKSVIV